MRASAPMRRTRECGDKINILFDPGESKKSLDCFGPAGLCVCVCLSVLIHFVVVVVVAVLVVVVFVFRPSHRLGHVANQPTTQALQLLQLDAYRNRNGVVVVAE